MAASIHTSNYRAMHRMARAQLRYGRDTVLDTSALVHESFIRAMASNNGAGMGSDTLLRYFPRISRNIVVESIRRRYAWKHGGCYERVDLKTDLAPARAPKHEEEIALTRALAQLEGIDGALAAVVKLRYFHGMTDTEIGAALNISDRTVRRNWDKARLLLAEALRP